MTVVIVAPATKGDQAEAVLAQVSRQVQAAFAAGTSLQTLHGPNLVRTQVDATLGSASLHVMYFGHGTSTACGMPAMLDSSNIGKVAGNIVLAIACSTANSLGDEAVNKHGVRAFLGFVRPVLVPLQRPGWSLTPWATPGLQLAAGATVQQAVNDTRRAFEAEGDRILANQLPTLIDAVNDMQLHYGMATTFRLSR